MHKRYLITALALLPGLFLALLGGCTSTDLGGSEIPNALPDTRMTGQPPSLLESGFIVHFYWSGSDPDGKVKGYQWKLSDNGTDGISVHDTLTSDPATGEILNPWHFTAATDSSFLVSADIAGFPGDNNLNIRDQRSFESHTLFIRAVDEEGGVDSTPAFMSFTATTLLPTIRVDRPARILGQADAQAVPYTITFGYSGGDPDFDLGVPTKVRFLFKTAWYHDHYVRTAYEFNTLVDQLISFGDSSWSPWGPYLPMPEQRLKSFEGTPLDEAGRQILYLFAIQAQDTAGAVSVDRTYGRQVQNVFVSRGITPYLVMEETYLGRKAATGVNSSATIDIASGQVLEFSWVASADDYAGVIETYRWGWDVQDPTDADDPNWAVQPGNTTQHRKSPKLSWPSGTHTLTIQVTDNSNQLTRFVWILEVVPVPDYSVQSPLMLVDDVADQQSQAWPAAGGGRYLDNDRYRDDFWLETLTGPGGVSAFDSRQDVYDLETSSIRYRDIVNYRSVLWSTRYNTSNFIWQTFKPQNDGTNRFIWLASYQETVGNLFLVGARALNEFIEEADWMIPWVFESRDVTATFGSQTYRVGFGERTLPDGTTVLIGKERYPYRAMGISVLDQTTPKSAVYGAVGLGSVGNSARSSACVGIKGLVMDPAFKSRYLPEGGVFPDTIYTDPGIDWKDLRAGYADSLQPWVWGNDEFYNNTGVSGRTTPWTEQICEDEPCVEPMFRIYSRFDWNDDRHLAVGDSLWPSTIFETNDALLTACGRRSLDLLTGRTKMTGAVCAFFSHKTEANKPNGKSDVMWGFDPYRFDRSDIQDAIHWVLGEHFGLTMVP